MNENDKPSLLERLSSLLLREPEDRDQLIGLLHLHGYDHEGSRGEAARMERRERAVLRRLGFGDPYAGEK